MILGRSDDKEFPPVGQLECIFSQPCIVSPPQATFKIAMLSLSTPGGGQMLVSGRGLTEPQARAGCIGEAAEYAALQWNSNLAKQRVSPVGLGLSIIPIEELLGFASDEPSLLFPGIELDWVTVEPLNRGSGRWVPAMLAYWHHPDADSHPELAHVDSIGAAAGRRLADAVDAALLELIERDAVAIWWYNRQPRPAIPATELKHSAISRFAFELASRARIMLLLNLTHDLGVPVAAAVSARADGGSVVIGTAAARSLRSAALRAVGELAQNLLGIEQRFFGVEPGPRDELAQKWLVSAHLADMPHLMPSDRRDEFCPILTSTRPSILKRLAGRGIRVYALKTACGHTLTPVVRLFAPGLRTTKPRFGPGRLFDVPVALGWRKTATPRSELNSWPYPF